MPYVTVLSEVLERGAGVVTLNRPQFLNGLNSELNRECSEAIKALERDPAIRAIVITGAGEKAFSAGGDIHELSGLTAEQAAALQLDWADSAWHLANLRVPTI